MSGVETLVKLAEWKRWSEWKYRSGQHFFPLRVSTFPRSAFLPSPAESGLGSYRDLEKVGKCVT